MDGDCRDRDDVLDRLRSGRPPFTYLEDTE